MIYAIIRAGVIAGISDGSISQEQAALVAAWLDLMEGVKD